MTIINLVLITIIVCFIIDCSGFINDGLKPFVAWLVNRKSKVKISPENINIGKPISCSLCMTWWTGIIYLLCTGEFTLINFTILSLLALVSSNISGLLLTLKDYLATFENWLQKLIIK